MSSLTMGELGPVLVDQRQVGLERLEELRRIPGYGLAVLQKFGAALPEEIYDAEVKRLRAVLRVETVDPVAQAELQLRLAYKRNDVAEIRRWESVFTAARTRRWLQGVQAKTRLQERDPVDFATAGFFSGLGGCCGHGVG